MSDPLDALKPLRREGVTDRRLGLRDQDEVRMLRADPGGGLADVRVAIPGVEFNERDPWACLLYTSRCV